MAIRFAVAALTAESFRAYALFNGLSLLDDAHFFVAAVAQKFDCRKYTRRTCADDVKCGHGATTGMLDENALFYMQQRGIDLKEARLLLLQAFSAEVLENITLPALADRLKLLIEKRLHGESLRCSGCNRC